VDRLGGVDPEQPHPLARPADGNVDRVTVNHTDHEPQRLRHPRRLLGRRRGRRGIRPAAIRRACLRLACLRLASDRQQQRATDQDPAEAGHRRAHQAFSSAGGGTWSLQAAYQISSPFCWRT
jgi:hypothetical protein